MVPFRDHIAMNMPEYVRQALAMLEDAGFEAFAVGGCVRDSILGRTPNDWDICTAALPEETGAVFAGYRTIDTGMKHGTCTVLMDGVTATDGIRTGYGSAGISGRIWPGGTSRSMPWRWTERAGWWILSAAGRIWRRS